MMVDARILVFFVSMQEKCHTGLLFLPLIISLLCVIKFVSLRVFRIVWTSSISSLIIFTSVMYTVVLDGYI